ncbi:MAG: hypothetical protein JNM18_14795 [Planctomycetaceae bacterium]|nr:hypothetical protein [Planctomycetaceae bacterium]
MPDPNLPDVSPTPTTAPPALTIHVVVEASAARQTLLTAIEHSTAQLASQLEAAANDAVQKAFFTHQAQRRAMLADLP